MTKIAEVKLSNCGLEVADFGKNCGCGIAELRLRSKISLKVAKLRLRKCLLQVAELRLRTQKKSCACPPLFKAMDDCTCKVSVQVLGTLLPKRVNMMR